MNARHAEINAKLNVQGIHTKGDILERIQRRERPILCHCGEEQCDGQHPDA